MNNRPRTPEEWSKYKEDWEAEFYATDEGKVRKVVEDKMRQIFDRLNNDPEYMGQLLSGIAKSPMTFKVFGPPLVIAPGEIKFQPIISQEIRDYVEASKKYEEETRDYNAGTY